MNRQCAPHFPGHARKNDALYLYGALQQKPYVFAYEQRDVEVVHGPSCRRDAEVFVGNCETDGVPVVERRSGGGTVVLGPGMVVTIVVGERRDHTTNAIFDQIHHAMIALLADAGLHGFERCGISDLAIGGRKILGSSLYRGNHPPLYYYQSSLLVAHDQDLFDRYLLHPPREPEYRGKRGHGEFCTSLAARGYPVRAATIARLFNEKLALHLELAA